MPPRQPPPSSVRSGGVTHIPWPEEGFSPFLKIALVTPAVAVIELGGVATAALADLQPAQG